MAYDNYYDDNGNYWNTGTDNPNQTPYKPSQDEWNRASDALNKYVSGSNPGATINWEKARAEFDKQAASGGNFGDWVNHTYDTRNTWLNTTAPNINPNSGIAGNPASGGKYDYEALRSAWLAPGFNTRVGGGQQELSDFIKNNPQFATGVTVRNDAIFDPSGRFIADLIGDVGGKNSRIFLRGSANNAKTPTKPAPKPLPPGTGTVNSHGPGSGAPPTAPGGPTSPPTSPPPPGNLPPGGPGESIAPVRDPRLDELYNTLLARSKQALEVNPNDAVIKAQVDPYRAEQERARRNYISDLAESQGPNANLRGEQRIAAERVGQGVSSFQGELMQRELTSRRDEIQNALTQMQGLLTTEQQQALQKELALIDDATRRLDINNRNSQFYADLGFRNKQLSEQARQFNKDLEYRNKALAEQSRIEAARLGYQYDSLEWIRSPYNPANRLS